MMALTRYQVCRMKDLSDKFYLLEEDPQCVNVCFWYVPKRLRGVPMSKEKEMELGKVTIREYIFLTTVTLMKTIQLRIWFKKPSLALSNTTYYFGLSIFPKWENMSCNGKSSISWYFETFRVALKWKCNRKMQANSTSMLKSLFM